MKPGSKTICDVNKIVLYWLTFHVIAYTHYISGKIISAFSLFAEFVFDGQGAHAGNDVNSADQRRFCIALNAQPHSAYRTTLSSGE